MAEVGNLKIGVPRTFEFLCTRFIIELEEHLLCILSEVFILCGLL